MTPSKISADLEDRAEWARPRHARRRGILGARLALPEEEMSRLRRRGFWLEYASMAWMTAEAAVAIISGIIASSIALIGFGLDSVIEFFAAAVVI
jgi:hypothetical protein